MRRPHCVAHARRAARLFLHALQAARTFSPSWLPGRVRFCLTTPGSVQDMIEVLPEQFFFVISRQPSTLRELSQRGVVLHVDNEIVYEPFCADFGPLNAGHTYRFCAKANAALQVRADSLCYSTAGGRP